MTPSFLVQPAGARRYRHSGLKEMAVFGLRKAFIDPAPAPKRPSIRMERFIGEGATGMDFWLPE